jgi:hypothetical protein
MYMVTDDWLNYKSAKYYETLTKFRHAAFREQSQNNSCMYKEMQYLPGPTQVEPYNSAGTDRVTVITAQNLIQREQSVSSDD